MSNSRIGCKKNGANERKRQEQRVAECAPGARGSHRNASGNTDAEKLMRKFPDGIRLSDRQIGPSLEHDDGDYEKYRQEQQH